MPLDTRSVRPASAGADSPPLNAQAARRGVFRKEGEFWTVGYADHAIRLKDTKGLGYIAHLLRYPGVEFHVLDLFGGIADRSEDDDASAASNLPRGEENLEQAGIHIANLGDAGEMLDDQAKAAYRRRLGDLRDELAEAKEAGNVAVAERAEEEMEALTKELSRAVGLGGRDRKAASASERARQSITKTIRSVIDRIAQSDAALGDFFDRCIKTGTYCTYQPDPGFPVAWEFAATGSSSSEEPAREPTSTPHPEPIQPARSQPGSPVLEVSPFWVATRTTLVGRAAELAALRQAIDRALSGIGSVVLLSGGTGVGKSRLAMEMAEYASRVGFQCLVGHCYERDEPFPYLPFVEIIESSLARSPSLDDFRRRIGGNASELAQLVPSLRRAFPDIPQLPELPPSQMRRVLLQGVSEALAQASRTRTYLYIVEDLHWADEATLALLIHLANRVTQLPVVILGTYRDVDARSNPALVRSLEELLRKGIRPLKLDGLSKEYVAQMLRELSKREPPDNLVDVICEESQGNPFFVEEVYRHLLEEGKVFDVDGRFRTEIGVDEVDVPENVRLVVSRRLERLSENERRALTAAAVIGRSFSFQLLNAISRIDIDELFTAIERAQQMGIIVASAEGPEKPFTFAHELVRQTLLAGISMPRKQQLHASVADAIERLSPGSSATAGEISDHLLKAGSFVDRRRLFDSLIKAGKAAMDAGAFEEARRSFLSALSNESVVDERERAALLTWIGGAEFGREQWEPALANLREALEIYTRLGDRETVAKTYTRLADLFTWVGRLSEATETAREGLTYLEGECTADHANLLAIFAQTSAAQSGLESACEALRQALKITAMLGNAKLEARVLGARSIVRFHFFQLKDAADDGLRSRELAGSTESPWQRALQLRILHQILLTLGSRDEAFKIADELEPLAIKIAQPYSVALCRRTRAWAEFGRAPDLYKLRAGLWEISTPSQIPRYEFWDILSEVQSSLLNYLRGNWAAALEHAEEACRPDADDSIRGFGEGVLFRQMAYCGDRDGALALLHDKRSWLPAGGRPNPRGSWLLLAAVIEGLVMLGEYSRAGELYPLAQELLVTGAVVLWPISRFTQTILGIVAGAAGDWVASEDHFKNALQEAESFPNLLEQADIRRFNAMMLLHRRRKSDRTQANSLLNAARQTYERIGMPRHLELIDKLLG